MTASFLWDLSQHALRLCFPTLADMILVANATSTVLSLMIDNSNRPPITKKVLKVKKRIDIARPDDIMVPNIKDTGATCAFEATEEAPTQPSIDPTIIVPDTGATIIEPITENIDSPLPGDDTREEASNIYIVDSAPMIAKNLDSNNPETEGHIYTHVLPTMDIFEVNLSAVDDLDDSAASASSSHYNDFERFLDEDRMMWIPRPAERVFRKKAVVQKVERYRQDADAARPTHVGEGADGKHVSTIAQSDDSTNQHAREVSTDAASQTSSTSIADTRSDTSETACTSPDNIAAESNQKSASPAIPEINLSPPTDISDEDANHIRSSLAADEPNSHIPIRASLPTFNYVYDYAYQNLTQEDLKNLDFVTILTDPISGNQYGMLTCGYWYWVEDDDNVRQMVEDEYENFLDWIDAILEGFEENEDRVEEVGEEEEEDWAELLRWKRKYELGRGWEVVRSFCHPQFADRKYALGNDQEWYFEYKGKFRRLMEDELDLLNGRLEDGSSIPVNATEDGPVMNLWGLSKITEEAEEES
ncbi:uncharacterized protein B0T23DRAFT_438902 [Neurospora hispaniola]|uniref:Uncharacterized protein n=1 Tax=Neurospora hispaniola TaxID=588809 RepID=A0AAJ0MUC3_9PEZI|nr:hypothetical protein B0T23DRAFT_438902 [Neurospora hispaniola]